LVSEQILKIGCLDFNLKRIFLTVSELNFVGIKTYENAGFKFERQLRQASYRDHRFHNKIMMSMLKSEYKKSKTTTTKQEAMSNGDFDANLEVR